MFKKKLKISVMLLMCSMLLFSGLIINHGSIKNLSIIDYPFESAYECFHLDSIESLGNINYPPMSFCKSISHIPFGF